MSPYVDTHCHVDLYPDPAKLVAEAAESSLHLVAVTNTPSVFEYTLGLTEPHPRLHASLGLHPQLVATRSQERKLLKELLPKTRFVGEVGLDYQTDEESVRELQRSIFTEIVEECSSLGDRILTIHSRRSSKDVLRILGGAFQGTAILHYFSGLKSEVDIASKRGCFFSVNPGMIQSKAGQQLVARMPQELVLTESDGPFVKYGNRPAEPKDVEAVLLHLAQAWACSVDEVSEIVFANFERATGIRAEPDG